MTNPTNKEILIKLEGLCKLSNEKFNGVYDKLDAQNAHLEKLNGQVHKNTSFRQKHYGVYAFVAFCLSLIGLKQWWD